MTLEQIVAVLTFAGTLAGAGIGAYVAVRVELAKVGTIARTAAHDAQRAHERIDALLSARG